MKGFFYGVLVAFMATSCVPKEQVTLREVRMNQIVPGKDGNPLLRAEAILFNPNNTTVRLKEIKIQVLLDGKPAASIDQKLNSVIKANSEFNIPLEVQLNMKETGLLDTLLSLFGGKKYEVQFTGTIRIKVSLFPVNIPIDHKDQIKF